MKPKRALEEKREERIAMIQGLLMFVCGTAFGVAIAAAWLPSTAPEITPALPSAHHDLTQDELKWLENN